MRRNKQIRAVPPSVIWGVTKASSYVFAATVFLFGCGNNNDQPSVYNRDMRHARTRFTSRLASIMPWAIRSSRLLLCTWILFLFATCDLNDPIVGLPYLRVVNDKGDVLEVIIDEMDEPEVWLNKTRLTNDVVNVTVEISRQINPGDELLGIVGSAPTVFYGTVYTNFGLHWAFLSIALVGFYLRFWDHLIFRKFTKSSISVALYAWLILHFAKLVYGGIGYILVDVKLIAILLIYAFLCYGQPPKLTLNASLERG